MPSWLVLIPVSPYTSTNEGRKILSCVSSKVISFLLASTVLTVCFITGLIADLTSLGKSSKNVVCKYSLKGLDDH
ncbi:MAG: hypothetical protein MJ203_04760 [archaeon]|nr:hypothetical protein [archaeon]